MSSYEYNQLLKFLYFEGYADSYEEAENLIEEMTDEEFEELLESSGMSPENRRAWERMVREKGPNPLTSPQRRPQRSARRIEQPSTTTPPRNKRKLEYEVREETEEMDEGFKEPNLQRMIQQSDRHMKKAAKVGGSRRSKNRAFKMDSIRSALERGEDPRADTFGGKRAENGNPPLDHRASYSRRNPLNNPPRPVKKAGVQREEFESIIEFLFVEGYTDTIESAELMAENISEDWANDIIEARASERRGMGSPQRPLGFRGQNIERGRMGGRRWQSGGEGGSRIERGLRNVPKSPRKTEPNEPQSQVQRLRGTEERGKYLKMQDRKRGSEIGSPRD